MIGTTIGKYRFVAPLGRGGMGTVFRAVDETLDREVAIKVLNPDLADTEVMKRFRAEAVTLAKLSHPDIATIYELYRSDSDLLMVMEFVRGDTLGKLMEQTGALRIDQAVSIVDRLLRALEHAHRAGIVHRDLKPANVMVTNHGSIKIMDFGVARMIGAAHETREGFLIGTPSYMSPEQVLGHDLDGRADLYSVGIIFYQLLTGALPFTADSVIAMAQKQVLDKPPPVQLYRQDLPEWCESILHRALAKSPAERFQTAEEFRVELARAMGKLPDEPAQPIPAAVLTLPEPRALVPAEATVLLRTRHVSLNRVALTVLAGGICIAAFFALRPARSNAAALPPSPVPALIAASISPERHAQVPPIRGNLFQRTVSIESTERISDVLLPPLVFDARALVDEGDQHRERRAKVLLADGMVTITAANDLLQRVPYEQLVSVTYSRGRDPQRNSPSGPTPIVRLKSGKFAFLKGVRHWIALRTSDRFIVLGVNEEQVDPVLAALADRTGHRAQRVVEREDKGPVPRPHPGMSSGR
jgi:predicted Ser/Thr protein kinase